MATSAPVRIGAIEFPPVATLGLAGTAGEDLVIDLCTTCHTHSHGGTNNGILALNPFVCNSP